MLGSSVELPVCSVGDDSKLKNSSRVRLLPNRKGDRTRRVGLPAKELLELLIMKAHLNREVSKQSSGQPDWEASEKLKECN